MAQRLHFHGARRGGADVRHQAGRRGLGQGAWKGGRCNKNGGYVRFMAIEWGEMI